jgi:phosphatidylserine synthase
MMKPQDLRSGDGAAEDEVTGVRLLASDASEAANCREASLVKTILNRVVRQLANVASILGLLPLCVLFVDDGFRFLIPFIVYNNFMDDLDGALAAKLNIRSQFGANLDNVCDAIAHTTIVMLVGMHYGGLCALASVLAAAAIVVRGVSRLDPSAIKHFGSPTNELVRHVFFILLATNLLSLAASPFLIAAFFLHVVSMLMPYRLPWLLRSMTKTATSIALLNLALLIAWLVPAATLPIAGAFVFSFLCSLGMAAATWLRPILRPPRLVHPLDEQIDTKS